MLLLKNTTELLLERDYIIQPRLTSSAVINENTRYITFVKQSGASLYCAAFINTVSNQPFDYFESYTSIKNRFYSYAQTLYCQTIYFIGIFIGDENELKDFCTLDIEDYSTPAIEMRWIIDGNKLIVNGNQPSKIIDLDTLIKTAIADNNPEYTQPVEIDTLIQSNEDKRKSAIKSKNTTLVFIIIAINCLALILTYINGGIDTETMIQMGALDSSEFFAGSQFYRLITSAFLHYGVIHLLSNMLFLYVFGSSIERYYGKLKFILIYIGAAITGGLTYCLLGGNGVLAGASGAVFGLTGATLAYSMQTKRAVDGRDTYFMIMFAIISICSGFLDENIANSAHIGGFVYGFLSGILLA